jgi:hypothetical protein
LGLEKELAVECIKGIQELVFDQSREADENSQGSKQMGLD